MMTKYLRSLLASLAAILSIAGTALAEPLKCSVSKSDEEGMIGVRREWDGKISRVFPDSPAEKAGLQPGDSIVEVDGISKGATTPGSVVGEPGTPVKLTIKRKLGFGDGWSMSSKPGAQALLGCGLPVYCFVKVELVRVPKSQIKHYVSVSRDAP